MIIGNFSYDPTTDTYSGELWTLAFGQAFMVLRPNAKGADKEPDYRIVQEDGSASAEIGAAWKRRSEGGKPFLSVVLDDPTLPAPINAALFWGEQDNTARLMWSRPKKDEGSAARQVAGKKRRSPRPRPPSP